MSKATRSPFYVGRFRAINLGTIYVLALGLMPATASATPPVPGQPTASCSTIVGGECYVSTDFTLSSAAGSEADHYRVCRSGDTTGWGGCAVVMTTDSGPSYRVSGDHLPSEGFRRAYQFSACDAAGDCTDWADDQTIYVHMDSQPPALASQNHRLVGDGEVLIGVEAMDGSSGVSEVRALVNAGDGDHDDPQGYFSWRDGSLGYLWPADQVPCAGGGFASKHPTRFNPAAVTLLGCRHSTDGVRRTVKFTIQRHPTAGELEPLHDVFFWARDFNLNGTSWVSFDHGTGDNVGLQLGELFGYAGINDGSQLAEVEAVGLPVNMAFLLYLNDETHPHYWRTLDTEGILGYYRDRGVRAVAVFENFLFEIIADVESPCFDQQTFRLRSDWRLRLDEFATLHGSQLNPEDVAMILVQSEVNDRCAEMDEVLTASHAIKQYFPDIPLTLAYGATHGHDGALESQPPPTSLPDIFDGIGIFSYGLYDAGNPLEPRNATDRFYNPQEPEDPTTVYGDLLSKLGPHQKVHLIFDAYFGPTHQALGWTAEDLAMVALNYADFMIARPEVVTLAGFHWRLGGAALGLSQLPPLVLDTSIEVACGYFAIDCSRADDRALEDRPQADKRNATRNDSSRLRATSRSPFWPTGGL